MSVRKKEKFKVNLPIVAKPSNEHKMAELIALLQKQPIEEKDIEEQEALGSGQYGTVHKVVHKKSGAVMAMKKIALGSDEQSIKQTRTELGVLYKSDSPYIVKFYGSFLKDTTICYCMEYMDSGSLDKLYRGGVPESVLAWIAYSTVMGLKYLKDQLHVIHRDVKPTNILMNHDGEIKLCDFGISGNLVQSVATTFVGCSLYMAPERINTTETREYDVRSDVWSLGISLLEIGNGVTPFPSTSINLFDLLKRIVEGDIPKLNSSFSDLAHNFIEQCLQRDVSKRATYESLLQHEWLTQYERREADVVGWLKTVKPVKA